MSDEKVYGEETVLDHIWIVLCGFFKIDLHKLPFLVVRIGVPVNYKHEFVMAVDYGCDEYDDRWWGAIKIGWF